MTNTQQAMAGDDKLLPDFVDWLITLCEFLSVFAISSSFYQLDDDEHNAEWFLTDYLKFWGPAIVPASIAVVVVPHLVHRYIGTSWTFLYHPHFPGTVQVIKIIAVASNIWYMVHAEHLVYGKRLKLQDGGKLASAGILALCETVSIVHTMFVAFEHTEAGQLLAKNNPVTRDSWIFSFFNLWKDFGIVSSLVETKELYFLFLEFPSPLLLSVILNRTKRTSRKAPYHLLRILLVAWGVATLFLSAKMHDDTLRLVDEKVVPLTLIVCEVVLALCEIKNGSDGSSSARTSTQLPTTNVPLIGPARAHDHGCDAIRHGY